MPSDPWQRSWYGSQLTLTDHSKNGVFVNDTRVQNSVALSFGDRIDIWGLSIVDLGSVLAIRPNENLGIHLEHLRQGEPDVSMGSEKIHYHRSPVKSGGSWTAWLPLSRPLRLKNCPNSPCLC